MISKNKIKLIHSLEQKKGRRQERLFVAEGPKVVGDLIAAHYRPVTLMATERWESANAGMINTIRRDGTEIVSITEEELRKVSFLQHPQQVMATFELPDNANLPDQSWFADNLCLALDGVQDPGNLGTIIRIADWFGIDTILCSRETADAYAPKVVQATMGSIARVRVVYTDLKPLLSSLSPSIPVYGTLLDGKDIYTTPLTGNGIIVMGNEGNGISNDIRPIVTHRLLIPSYPPDRPTAESLNVAIATAIVCGEFRRR